MTDGVLQQDVELLALAREVLAGEGYSVDSVRTSSGLDLVLAENPLFIVAVAAVPTVDQLRLAESFAADALSQRFADVDLGPKRWDAYLVLLSQESRPEQREDARVVFELTYDTHAVRRIVRLGVIPTMSEVRRSLQPFVRPIELSDPSIAKDPLEMMIESLVEHGVSREIASRSVHAFKQGASVGDVV
jgi:hypothetical protein